jgi:hypothetical protein
LQMFADNRPDFMKSVSAGQAVQAQNIARRLHMPEGRVSPSPSRPLSQPVVHGTFSTTGQGLSPASSDDLTPPGPSLVRSLRPIQESSGTSEWNTKSLAKDSVTHVDTLRSIGATELSSDSAGPPPSGEGVTRRSEDGATCEIAER